MLDIDDAKRSDLILKGALTVDRGGDETLTGLSLAETHAFLALEKQGHTELSPVEMEHYLKLKHKHLAARSALLAP